MTSERVTLAGNADSTSGCDPTCQPRKEGALGPASGLSIQLVREDGLDKFE
jgi:hypothetical protein